ncbi:MAG: mechanosensitive ion channel family protein [Rhabdochlamydiaceae bacterium]|jgi:MscS family membrane protein
MQEIDFAPSVILQTIFTYIKLEENGVSMGSWSELWWVEILIGLLLLTIVQLGTRKIICVIRKKQMKSPLNWRYRIGSIIQPPMTLVLWVVGVVYAIEIIGQRFGFVISVTYMHSFRNALIVGAVSWLILRWANDCQKSLLLEGSRKVDITTIQMIGKLVTICIIFVSGLTVMQIFGLSIAPLLAIGTIGGVSLGFGGKDIIANFCSGIIFQMTRPFVIGDLIYLPEKALEGVVEDIGWFRLLIRDKEKREVSLPNNFCSTLLVINISRMTHRRIRQVLKLPLGKIKHVVEVTEKIKKMLMSHSALDALLSIQVHVHEIGDYSCNVEIEAFSKEVDLDKFNEVQQEILLNVQNILKAEDLQMAVQPIQLIDSKQDVV